jgi:hypothetical protein
MKNTLRATLVIVLLLALAATARAAGDQPTIGASVQSVVYTDQSRTLTVINRSSIPALFAFSGSAGWTTDPAQLVIAPGEKATVEVRGDGEDGAAVTATVTPSDFDVPEGAMGTALTFDTRIYHEAPFDPMGLVGSGLLLVGALVLVYLTVRWARRNVRVQIGRPA